MHYLGSTRPMITIDNLSDAGIAEAGAVLDAAFGREGMVAGLRLAYALQPKTWFCARDDGPILAVVGAHDYGPFASIGMMGVHPLAQRQGLGERLMAHLTAYLDARGCPLLLLDASAAGRRLYPKLGFFPEGETLRLARVQGAATSPRPAAGVAEFLPVDLPHVAAFDAAIFGANRADVLRSFRDASPGRAFVARDECGRVAGYMFAGGNHLGPWVAAEPAVAEMLLAAALALPFDRPPFLTCPAANAGAQAMLALHGFAVTERLVHMRRGGERDPRRPDQIYAQASLTLG